jgi:HAD superfamily hydrolase (TIGR01509 family)
MSWLDQIDLFLLDLDGTLIDTEPLHLAAWKKVLLTKGYILDWSLEEYLQVATGEKNLLQKSFYAKFPKLDEKAPLWDNLRREKDIIYHKMLNEKEIPLRRGVESFLEYLKKKNKISCIVTNSSRETCDMILKEHPILNQIGHWIVRNDYKNPKPHPECYLLAIEKYGKNAKKIMGFEDTVKGLTALCQTPAKPIFMGSKELLNNSSLSHVLHLSNFEEVLAYTGEI